MPTPINLSIDDPRLLLGIVEIQGGTVRESSVSLQSACLELACVVCEPDFVLDEGRRSSVRRILKLAGFSATGRNKPAHEFLLADLRERGSFNLINNCVDVNNYISLKHALPISILDAGKLEGQLTIRIANEDEAYVFNNAGHEIAMKKSIVLCRGAGDGEPTGGPVKDSMATKIFEDATDFLAVIYGSTEGFTRDDIQAAVDEMATLLASETGGEIVRQQVLPE
jgi:DNA/RNA-binding domain of Phe-tRNA-synthetase-like protein